MLEAIDGLADTLKAVLAKVGVPQEELDKGMELIRYGIAQVGLEAGRAQSLGIGMAKAVCDAEQFPALHRLHLGLLDILTLNLPLELRNFARQIFNEPLLLQSESFRLEIARAACSQSANPVERAFARVLLYEAVRLNVLVCTWPDQHELTRLGVESQELDDIAESQVNKLLQNPDLLEGHEPVRPLHVLVASALSDIDDLVQKASRALAYVVDDIRQHYEMRARLEEKLKYVDAQDAVLIRNYFAPVWEEQRLSVERLVGRHPLLFEGYGRNTLDQRLRRRLTSLASGRPLTATKQIRLIDLMLESRGASS